MRIALEAGKDLEEVAIHGGHRCRQASFGPSFRATLSAIHIFSVRTSGDIRTGGLFETHVHSKVFEL